MQTATLQVDDYIRTLQRPNGGPLFAVWKGETGMKETYLIAIDRPGMGDIPELCRVYSPDTAAEMVRCLLACSDPNIARVKVEILRTVSQERAV